MSSVIKKLLERLSIVGIMILVTVIAAVFMRHKLEDHYLEAYDLYQHGQYAQALDYFGDLTSWVGNKDMGEEYKDPDWYIRDIITNNPDLYTPRYKDVIDACPFCGSKLS